MKIEKTNNEIIVHFPVKRDRIDPYSPDRDAGQFPNLIGLVTENEWGLARRIDMAYKNKPDQIGQMVVNCTHLSKEEFIEQCQDAHITVDYRNNKVKSEVDL